MKPDMKLSTFILIWVVGMAFLMWFMTLDDPAGYTHDKVNTLIEAITEKEKDSE